MGQKVHPLSMRLQVTKDWRSRWFVNKREFKAYLTQDVIARQLIEKKFEGRGGINRVDIERSPNLVTVTIFTAKAGVIIGRGGAGATELKAAFEKIFNTGVRVNIEEVRKPETQAKLVAESIAYQMQKRIAFRRAVKSAAGAAMRAGAKGVRIEVAGRLGGAEMSRREKEIQGSVPLHTIRADVDYGSATAHYPGSGLIGVKVWIYKGEVSR